MPLGKRAKSNIVYVWSVILCILINLCVGFLAVVPSAATIVIVVCVSFLVFMIILGVFRIRAAHQRTMRDQESGKENEMDWDDSALTITVNPMEVKTHERERQNQFFSWLAFEKLTSTISHLNKMWLSCSFDRFLPANTVWCECGLVLSERWWLTALWGQRRDFVVDEDVREMCCLPN